jgi:hypothetical protein
MKNGNKWKRWGTAGNFKNKLLTFPRWSGSANFLPVSQAHIFSELAVKN